MICMIGSLCCFMSTLCYGIFKSTCDKPKITQTAPEPKSPARSHGNSSPMHEGTDGVLNKLGTARSDQVDDALVNKRTDRALIAPSTENNVAFTSASKK